jgi:lipoic acid synthetase
MTQPKEPMSYDPSAKQKGAGKTSRIPIKVVPVTEVLRKPDWIRVRAASHNTRFFEIKKPRARTSASASARARRPS